MNKIFAPFLPPWVETGLQPAFYDMESGTVLQQTARMYAKVQQLTRLFNEFSEDVSNEVNNFEHDTNTEIKRFEQATNDEIERFEGVVNGTVAEYIEKFTELKDFVDDYFDNLDVQKEINNKLDAMVEDGTLEKLLNSYSTLQYIFPKHENESYSTWGDISLLKLEDKVICIDTGLDDRWSEIYLMLSSNNITHIDRLIISHYHNDHINNLQNLITAGFLTPTSLVYLCGDVKDWAEIVTTQTYVKTLLTNNNIPYTNPEEGDIVDYNGLTLQFNNIANLDDLYYSAGDYNACSMCVGITYKNHKSLFTGDATASTLKHLHDLNVDKEKVDLYKIGHHAIGQQTYRPFIDSIHPNIAVVIASITDSSRNMNAYNEECDIVERNGGLVYPTFSQDSYLIFETNGENARCIQGNPRNVASTIITNEIYVDASVDNDAVQDGSQDYPFNNIQQALGSQQNYLDVLTIHVASGTYIPIDARSQKNIVKISGKKFGRVEIIGDTSHPENVIVQDVIVENANVKISGITIKTSEAYYDGVVAKNSKVSLINVYIGDSTNPTHYASVTATTSELFFKNCELAYHKNGIILNEASYAMIIDSTFDHITETFMSANNSHYNTKNITVTNSTPKYFPTRKNQNSSVIISNTDGDATVTSTVPLSTFEYIKLTLRTNDYNAFAVEVPVGGSIRYYDASTKFFGGDGSVCYEKCARITINPTDNTISISRRHEITTVVSTGVSTYTTPDHNFYFTKIEGVFSTIG